MKIVIIGTGNVAAVLGSLLYKSGHQIIQVFGRSEASAQGLSRQLNCSYTSSWADIDKQADLYLAAISDNGLHELDRHLTLSDQLIVHTAGSVSKKVLQPISANYGVLYPLQSLRKELPVLTEIPFLVDAGNEDALQQIVQVAAGLSSRVSVSNDEQRLKLHLAAVVVNNFVNHLYVMTEDFCKKENIPFALLLPLIGETSRRMEQVSPALVITGPAVRNDKVTIDRHIRLLETYPLLLDQYKRLTESIWQYRKGLHDAK